MAKEQTVWTPQSPTTGATPQIGDQFIAIGQQTLVLRRPHLEVSALMAQMYALVVIVFFPIVFRISLNVLIRPDIETSGVVLILVSFAFICGISLFLFINIRRLKMSHIYFNRRTQHIYGKEGHRLYEGDWHGVQASPRSFVDGSNVGAMTRFRLEMLVPSVRPLPPHRFWQKRLPPETFLVRIMSNAQTDPRTDYVAQVWEYIRTFMEHGPDTLPIPTEPNWWMLPLHQVVLTPRQAFRHYVPWRTGEPGERQGKKNWLLPVWALLFPLTISVSLCWWVVCCLLGVHPLVSPVEALEGETAPLVTIEMASKGVRP